jgi:hypothetical protein
LKRLPLFTGAEGFFLGLGVAGDLHGELAEAGGYGAGVSNVSEAAASSIGSQNRALKILRNNYIAQ